MSRFPLNLVSISQTQQDVKMVSAGDFLNQIKDHLN